MDNHVVFSLIRVLSCSPVPHPAPSLVSTGTPAIQIKTAIRNGAVLTLAANEPAKPGQPSSMAGRGWPIRPVARHGLALVTLARRAPLTNQMNGTFIRTGCARAPVAVPAVR